MGKDEFRLEQLKCKFTPKEEAKLKEFSKNYTVRVLGSFTIKRTEFYKCDNNYLELKIIDSFNAFLAELNKLETVKTPEEFYNLSTEIINRYQDFYTYKSAQLMEKINVVQKDEQ